MNTPITLPTPAGAPSPSAPAAGSSGNGSDVAMDNVVVQLGSGVTIVNGGIKLPDDMRTSQRNEPSIKGRGK